MANEKKTTKTTKKNIFSKLAKPATTSHDAVVAEDVVTEDVVTEDVVTEDVVIEDVVAVPVVAEDVVTEPVKKVVPVTRRRNRRRS